jgi:hypothetical protein
MKPDDERELAAEDRQLIEGIDAALRPAPMSAARRAAFRTALEERIAHAVNPWRWLAPAFAATAATAVTFWLIQPDEPPPVQASSEASELYAFIDSDAVSAELTDVSSYLPDDYRALALLIEPYETEP